MNDKEGRKWLLQKLYESKYRYIYRAENHKLYVTISKPITLDGVYYKQADCGLTMKLMSAICPLFDDVRSFISISEELGIVDWSKMAVDTPVKARVYDSTGALVWRNYHFAKYKNGNVYCWADGLTSWGVDNLIVGNPRAVIPFGVKLAGGSDEN